MGNTSITEREWAEERLRNIETTRQACRAFDSSPDGARYRRITGVSMWANLGADTLPED